MPSGEDNQPRPLLGNGKVLARDAEKFRGPPDKYHPRTFAEARELLGPMVETMRTETARMPEGLRGERIVFEAELLPNYLAASHHPAKLRRAADLVVVGTKAARGILRTKKSEKADQATKSLLLAGTEESLRRLDHLIRGTDIAGVEPDPRVLQDITKFERLELAGVERIVRRPADAEGDAPPEVLAWEAVLHPSVDATGRVTEAARDIVLSRWRALVGRLGGSLHDDFIRSVGNLIFMPVELSEEALEAAASFNPLRVLRPMPQMRRLPTGHLRNVDLGDAAPQAPASLPAPDRRIAIFDGGVDASHSLLAPYVNEISLTDSPPDEQCQAHGAMVTSAALFGHMEIGKALETPPASVDHFRLFPPPSNVHPADEVYWVTDRIEETLRGGPHKLAVLSYGPEQPVDESLEPDRFTAVLDQLAYLDGITFCVAVGNNGQATISPLGLDRVMVPADGANVVGVGACEEPGDSKPSRATFSAVGPGRPGMRIQPMGVCFGGAPGREFLGAGLNGGFQTDYGTSYSAPAAARGLATLMAPLGRSSFNANTARAFAAHFARGCEHKDHSLIELGHGRLPEDYVPDLQCRTHEMTILVEDTLLRGQTKGYPFPVPAGGLTGMIELRWTVSFVSPIDEEDAAEYTLTGLDIDFRPNRARYALTPPRGTAGSAVDVDLRTQGSLIQQRINEGWQLSNNPKTRPGSAVRSEQTQREEGKWETVVRHRAGARATSLHQPEVWLTYYERAQGELIAAENAHDLDFAMLMTISAPKVINLYETLRADAAYSKLVPITVPVDVTVDASGS